MPESVDRLIEKRNALLEQVHALEMEIQRLVSLRPLRPARTARQEEILKLVRLGYANKKIADSLNVTLSTVRFHISNLLKQHNCSKRGEL